jgi:hypothetical protein
MIATREQYVEAIEAQVALLVLLRWERGERAAKRETLALYRERDAAIRAFEQREPECCQLGARAESMGL